MFITFHNLTSHSNILFLFFFSQMNTPNITLLDLNDDCLNEILKYITIQDTFNFMKAHTRFRDVAYERIAQLKHLEVNFREPPQHTLWQYEVIGMNLRSLYITAGYSLPTEVIVQYLRQICYQATHLNTIKLHYIHFDEECQKCLISIAGNIEDLNLNYCSLTDELLGTILNKCVKLKYLSLLGNYTLKCDSLKCLNSKYLKLVQVEQNEFCKDSILAYVASNPQVSVKIYRQGRLNFNLYGPAE